MLLRIFRAMAFISLITFLVSIFSLGWLDNQYVAYSQAPDISSQRVVPYPVKGVVVYVTELERKTLSILSGSELVSMLTFALIVALSGGRAVTTGWPLRRNERDRR